MTLATKSHSMDHVTNQVLFTLLTRKGDACKLGRHSAANPAARRIDRTTALVMSGPDLPSNGVPEVLDARLQTKGKHSVLVFAEGNYRPRACSRRI